MGQLGLFNSAQLAVMRDPTARRNYSAEAEEFRREHERHRAWGLKRRYAEKARRAGGGQAAPRPASAPVATHSPASAGRAPAGQITAEHSTAEQSTAGQSTVGPPANGQSSTRQGPAGGTAAAPTAAQQSARGTGERKAAAAKRNRSKLHAGAVEPGVVMLTFPEREEISRGPAKGLPCRDIGVRLGRDASIVSWRVGHDGGRAGYRVVAADTSAPAGRARPTVFAVERPARLRQVVTDRLRSGSSPNRPRDAFRGWYRALRLAGWHTKRATGGSTPIPSRRGPRNSTGCVPGIRHVDPGVARSRSRGRVPRYVDEPTQVRGNAGPGPGETKNLVFSLSHDGRRGDRRPARKSSMERGPPTYSANSLRATASARTIPARPGKSLSRGAPFRPW
jgi:Helix-turn-helix domain